MSTVQIERHIVNGESREGFVAEWPEQRLKSWGRTRGGALRMLATMLDERERRENDEDPAETGPSPDRRAGSTPARVAANPISVGAAPQPTS